jgi:hypothetical protein
MYNYWAIISLESAAVLFWLIALGLLADITAALVAAESVSTNFNAPTYTCDASGYCYYAKRALSKRNTVDPASAIIFTALALSVIEWYVSPNGTNQLAQYGLF